MNTELRSGRQGNLTLSQLVLALALVAGAASCSPSNYDTEVDASARARPACRDGIDNDGDGRIDYPADPGCSSKNDNSEDTDNPPSAPAPDAASPDAASPDAASTTTTSPDAASTTTTSTDAASVDTTRMPVPPQSSTVINVTSPITISGTVTDVTYNVTGSMPNSTAISLGSTGRLERVRVNVNGNAMNGVGGGTLKDVYVTGATYAGVASTRRFEGVVFATNNYVDFYLSGSGVTLPADAMIKSSNLINFSFLAQNLADSKFDGPIVSLAAAGAPPAATAFECWGSCQRNLFNIIISNKAPGYGLAIYGTSSVDNVVNEFLGNGNAGTGDSDPGISIGAGATRNVIHKATVKRYTVGVVFGEDVDPSPYGNFVHTLIVEDAYWGCVFMDRGAYNNVVGDVGGTTCTNTGGVDDTHWSSVWIANRPGQTNVPPHDNQVLGLAQSGQLDYPRYAAYLGSGTTRNTVSGTATFWTIAKVLDQGSGNNVNLQ